MQDIYIRVMSRDTVCMWVFVWVCGCMCIWRVVQDKNTRSSIFLFCTVVHSSVSPVDLCSCLRGSYVQLKSQEAPNKVHFQCCDILISPGLHAC